MDYAIFWLALFTVTPFALMIIKREVRMTLQNERYINDERFEAVCSILEWVHCGLARATKTTVYFAKYLWLSLLGIVLLCFSVLAVFSFLIG